MIYCYLRINTPDWMASSQIYLCIFHLIFLKLINQKHGGGGFMMWACCPLISQLVINSFYLSILVECFNSKRKALLGSSKRQELQTEQQSVKNTKHWANVQQNPNIHPAEILCQKAKKLNPFKWKLSTFLSWCFPVKARRNRNCFCWV